MKIDNKTLAKMEQDIKTVIQNTDIPVKIKDMTVYDLNNIWFIAWCNRTYPDNHPMVKKDQNNKRILSFIDRDNYDLYPCQSNDTTIYTAFKQILKNLQTK
jgi:hypothetical protein